MYTCLICRFPTERDDAVVQCGAHGFCICLRCYTYETHTALKMPKRLQRDVAAALEVA